MKDGTMGLVRLWSSGGRVVGEDEDWGDSWWEVTRKQRGRRSMFDTSGAQHTRFFEAALCCASVPRERNTGTYKSYEIIEEISDP